MTVILNELLAGLSDGVTAVYQPSRVDTPPVGKTEQLIQNKFVFFLSIHYIILIMMCIFLYLVTSRCLMTYHTVS